MRTLALFLVAAGSLAADTSRRKSWPWRMSEDFSGTALSRWESVAGKWRIEDGAAVGRGEGAPDGNAVLRLRTSLSKVTELEADVRIVEAGRFAGAHFQFGGRYFYLYTDGSGVYPPYVCSVACLTPDRTAKVRLSRAGDRYRFVVDGMLVVETTGRPAPELREDEISLWATHGATVRYDNVRVR